MKTLKNIVSTGVVIDEVLKATIRNVANSGLVDSVLSYEFQGGAPAPVFDPDYQAVLDRATVLGYPLPSPSQQILQNALVLALKAAGIWTLLEIFYVFATDAGALFATLNWRNPLLYQCSLVNSPTFTANFGFTGNGTTSYIDTNFSPSINAVIATNNNGSIGCQVTGGNQANRDSTEMGSFTSPSRLVQIVTNLTNNNGICRFCCTPGAVEQFFNSGAATGRYMAVKRASTLVRGFKNAAQVSNNTLGDFALPVPTITFLCLHQDASFVAFSDRRIGGGFFSASLDGKESAYDTAWTTYFNAL